MTLSFEMLSLELTYGYVIFAFFDFVISMDEYAVTSNFTLQVREYESRSVSRSPDYSRSYRSRSRSRGRSYSYSSRSRRSVLLLFS